jgi:chromosome partitioning protein
MDPQASLTVFMGLEPHELPVTIADAILRESSLPVLPNIHNMALAPANITLSAAEIRLSSVIAREWRLGRVLEPVVNNYDFILIDCPPTLSILSILSLVASTHVLIPLQTQYKAFKGTELLLDTIKQVREDVNSNLKVAGVIPTLYSATTVQDKAILEATQQQLGEIAPVLPAIPRAIAFADAAMAHQPLAVFAPKHPALSVLDTIAQSLENL